MPTTSPALRAAVVTWTPARRRPGGSGLAVALASAAAFGLSGSFAAAVFPLGWSPAAVVVTRLGLAFAVLVVPCALLLRPVGLPTRRGWGRLVAYGLVPVAGAQLCFFSAVQRLPVGVALLLEYTAPVLLVFWCWARGRRRPAGGVFVGAALALLGLGFVLDLGSGVRVDPVGVVWALGAALCLAAYFLLSAADGPEPAPHPLLLTSVGTGLGGAAVLVVGATGLLPLTVATGRTALAGVDVAWWLPLLLLGLVSATFAYLTGIVAVRRLGGSVASFVALSEVLFAVAFAAVLLGQHPRPAQLLGATLVLAGIVVVQRHLRP